ncbi:DUF7033 domain-containing protein [Aquirufa sp. OSTEICH-129A]
MIIIKCNFETFESELNYITSFIFNDVFGLEYRIENTFCDDIMITSNYGFEQIELPNIFFKNLNENWLTESSLPSLPLEIWDTNELSGKIPLINDKLPIIYGKIRTSVIIENTKICLPIDIFGSAFFMLSRYEELIKGDNLDLHQRYSSFNSISSKAKFLDRPIIDEYIEVLWVAINRLWPNLKRKEKSNKLNITCDVDSLFDLNSSMLSIIKGVSADLLKRKSIKVALRNFKKRCLGLKGNFLLSQHYSNIIWMMEVNEKAGNVMCFYFLSGGKNKLDSNYDFGSKYMRLLLREIHSRGHIIGIHPSYDTLNNEKLFESEVVRFLKVLREEGIKINNLRSRQHYLRWSTRNTPGILDANNVYSDSTLAFADNSGYRSGTSRTYPMYNILRRKALKTLQEPLIIMETTVISNEYLGLGYSEAALRYMLKFKEDSMRISGQFTLLWHNSSFENNMASIIYNKLIQNN